MWWGGTEEVGCAWIWGSQRSLPTPIPSTVRDGHNTELPAQPNSLPVPQFPPWVGGLEGGGWGSHLRLAIRLLLRPIPRHFSRWGAKREAAMLRLQLGQTHSLFFHWLYTCPKMSTPGWSTISEGQEGQEGGGGQRNQPSSTSHPRGLSCCLPPPFPPHQSPSCCRGRCHPGRSSRI